MKRTRSSTTYDEIVIGSGLSALGAVLGLNPGRRILILAGPTVGEYSHYNAHRLVPCAYQGLGGLGNDWHGVIPLSLVANFGGASPSEFVQLFARFFPHTRLEERLGKPLLFVPWRAIRPARELGDLSRRNPAELTLIGMSADRFGWGDSKVSVKATNGLEYHARRLWIAAGSIHTPGLVERSLGSGFSRGYVSDHAFCYVGLSNQTSVPSIQLTRDGALFPAQYAQGQRTLYTLRPARFAFRKLDFGIEQRAVFGMPTGSAVAKILRRMSPGLLAEAFYNRFGAFPAADCYSVYGQTAVRDAYVLGSGSLPLTACTDNIRHATDLARGEAPIAGLQHSMRPDLYIPGIHLHHSIDLAALQASGINQSGAPVQIVDASIVPDIGPDHHSFKTMLLAFKLAQRAPA